MDNTLDKIFSWGHGFGGLLFMIFVAGPIVGTLVAGFLEVVILGFSAVGLI